MEELFNTPDAEGFYEVLIQEYTNEECKTFVKCIMSRNIQAEDTMRCLTAIGCSMGLSHDTYEKAEADEEEGTLDHYTTSDFQEFVNEGVQTLLYDNDQDEWIRFLLKELLAQENYELLHTLKLEKTWNI